MKLRKLVADVRGRRVFRVVVAYLLVVGPLLMVTMKLSPVRGLPAWVVELVVAVALLGFPVAVAAARSIDRTRGAMTHTAARNAPSTAHRRTRRGRVLRPVPIGITVLIMLMAGGWYTVQQRSDGRADELDATRVAVLPFRVVGTDAELEYLREGMVDLLALKLSGTRRAVDVRALLVAWRAHALRRHLAHDDDPSLASAKDVATALDARTVVLGSVAGSAGHVTVSASLIDVATGHALASGAQSGNANELTTLVDELVATVLARYTGATRERLASLTSTSPPALRDYLTGNAHYRRGEYHEALARYARALDTDSTFALAALHALDAAVMESGVPAEWQTRGLQVLRAHRGRLAERDRAYADARWPAEPTTSVGASLERLEAVAQQFPDRAEVWFHLGDALYRTGGLIGTGEHLERARAAFDRALALDSTYATALQRVLSVAEQQNDSAFVLRFAKRYLDMAPAGAFAIRLRLREAQWRGDTVALRRMYVELDTLDAGILTGIAIDHQLTPRPRYRLEFARRAAELLRARASGSDERSNALLYRYQIEMNAGRPLAAVAAMDSVPPIDALAWDRRRMYDAVYWDGDSAAAAVAAERVERHLQSVPSGALTDLDATALCAATTLRLAQWQTEGAAAAIERLRVPHPASTSPLGRQICAATLAALLSDIERAPDAEARLLALDSLLRTGPLVNGFREHGNITAARLFEARGDIPRARAAARRRLIHPGGQSYLSTFLELECRLAAAARDHGGATRACTRYLALRSDPEPPAAERVTRARRTLAVLEPR